MKTRYNPKEFENAWIEQWEKTHVYQTSENNTNKTYILAMFPYPSGSGLHVGHARIYTGTDVIARYIRMKHGTVLYPMGWDAFGLPAENAAIKAKKNPMDMVPDNIANYKLQMKKLGLSYDWDKELATTDPHYYKWTQRLFIEFFKMGLLYKQNTLVYFCEFCKTGLAEEEVLPNGTHERCGNNIVRKTLPQWIFKITAFADKLLNDLDGLDWPEGILAMQRKWIGKKEGMEISFKIQSPTSNIKDLNVWTGRPETIYGVTYLVLAPEHEFVQRLVETSPTTSEVSIYVKSALSKTDEERLKDQKEKTGVFTGLYAIHPLTNKEIPIWISDYVLSDVGSGAVMGVPAHDKRDGEFAQIFNLPHIEVIKNEKIIHSELLDGLSINDARNKIKAIATEKLWGNKKTRYHLRDWIFSRQRYWGEPIPMIYCEACRESKASYFDKDKSFGKYLSPVDKENILGWFPVQEELLPLELPYIKSYEPSEDGSSPLSQISEFVNATCPHCGGKARRETDTMPNWAGSCWYYLAFPWWENESAIKKWPKMTIDSWAPVDWYVGGAEHAVLHLLYARFWTKALHEIGYLGFTEPFIRLRNVGMVGAEDGQKMSKSKGNVINPNDVVNEYGADTLRVYEMFMAPFSQDIAWSTQAMQGSYRFLVHIWQIYTSGVNVTDDINEEDKELVVELQRLILKITNDLTDVKFNTSIAAMMKFLNLWGSPVKAISLDADVSHSSGFPPIPKSGTGLPSRSKHASSTLYRRLSIVNAKKFLQVLAPFAPFISEELWHNVLKETGSIHISSWPTAEKIDIKQDLFKIPVQVNGKLRGLVEVEDTQEQEVIKAAMIQENIAKYLEGKQYHVLYIKEKVLNFIYS